MAKKQKGKPRKNSAAAKAARAAKKNAAGKVKDQQVKGYDRSNPWKTRKKKSK